MRALFLGSGGRVGTLLRAAWETCDVDPIWHTRTGGNVSFDIMDIDLEAAVVDCDVVVNLAGATHHSTSDIGGSNTTLAQRVLDCAKGRPVFVMSSAAVYGKLSGKISEHSILAPISDYGRDKTDMEAMTQEHSAKSVILRLGNVAGADALLGTDRERYFLDVFPDAHYPHRSYIGPKLLAKTLTTLIKAHNVLPPVLNVATASAVSMGDLLKAAGKSWDDTPAGPDAISNVELNTDLLEQFADMPLSSASTIVEDWTSVRAAL